MQTKYCESYNIKHIFHLADIHIPNKPDRNQEFREVFNNLGIKIKSVLEEKKLNPNEIIIYVAGDIFDKSTSITPEALSLFNLFITELTNITDVFIIPGNHDDNIRANGKQTIDLISSAIEKWTIPNLYYIKDTGIYYIGTNLIIYHISVFDIDKIYNSNDTLESKKEQYLKLLINKINDKSKIHILFIHTDLQGAVLQNGIVSHDGKYTISDLEKYKYDYVLLGDIHTVNNIMTKNNMILGYPGSLLQLSHGETYNNHGFLLWNLETKTQEHYKVENNYGFLTVSINDDINNIEFPQYSNIRIKYNTTENYEEIIEIKRKEIEEKTTIIDWRKQEYNTDDDIKLICYEDNINNLDLFKEYINNNYNEDQKSLLINMNNEYMKQVDHIDYKSENSKWELTELIVNDVLCFHKQNLKLSTFNKHQSIGIIGENGNGKSSINKSILYAMYGIKALKTTTLYNLHNKYSKSNSNYVTLYFTIGSKKYYIHRTIKLNKVNVSTGLFLFEYINNEYKNISGIGTKETQVKIDNLLGPLEYFLHTSGFNEKFMIKNYTSTEILNIIEGVLGLKPYQLILLKIKPKISRLKMENDVLSREINKQKDKIIKIGKLDDLINNNKLHQLNIDDCNIKSDKLIKDIKSYEEILDTQGVNKNKDLLLNKIKLIEIDINKKKQMIKPEKQLINIDELEQRLIVNKQVVKDIILYETENDIIDKYKLYERDKHLYNDIIMPDNYDYKQEILNSKKQEKELQTVKQKKDKSLKKYNNDIKNINKEVNNNEINKYIKLLLNDDYKYNQEEYDNMTLQYEQYKVMEYNKQLQQNTINIKSEHLKKFADHKYDDKCSFCISNFNELHILKKELEIEYNKLTELTNNLFDINKYNEYKEKLGYINKLNQCKLIQQKNTQNIKIDTKIKKYDITIKELEQVIGKSKIHINNYTKKNELEQVLINTKKYNDLYDQIKDTYKLIKDDEHKLQVIKGENNNIIMNKEMNNQLNSAIDLSIKELGILKGDIDKLPYFLDIKIKKINTEKELKLIECKLIHINNDIINNNKLIENIKQEQEELIQLQNRFNSKNNEWDIYKTYCSIIDKKGYPLYLINKKLPVFIKEINTILDNIVSFKIEYEYTEDKEDKEYKIILYKTENNIQINIGSLSGFESFIITLLIRIALPKISNIIKPNFFIIDEGFDSVDINHLSKFNKVIDLLEYKYDYPIIISHSEEVKDKVKNIIKITNKHEIIQ
jgi:DNA repair exonuclease SbcCD ATPase subunit